MLARSRALFDSLPGMTFFAEDGNIRRREVNFPFSVSEERSETDRSRKRRSIKRHTFDDDSSLEFRG